MGSSLDIYKKRNNSRLNHNQEGSIPFESILLQQSEITTGSWLKSCRNLVFPYSLCPILEVSTSFTSLRSKW